MGPVSDPGCGFSTPGVGLAGVAREPFGATPDGRLVEAYTLTNAHGVAARLISYGGALASLRAPDRDGRLEDVTLGFDSLEDYQSANNPFLGALIGRYANRIARGRFVLDGREHTVEANDGPNHLHGGSGGFHAVVWDAEPFGMDGGVGVVLSHTSHDGEQGYPGTLRVRVRCTLTDDNELAFDYHATTDRPTPVNLSQHSYWNLAGDGARDILDHELTLAAACFTPVDPAMIPTGELRAVAGTPFDFTVPRAIGARIDDADEQLRLTGGYDHNFVLDRRPDAPVSLAARLLHPHSGRVLEVFTTEPGLQVYSGNNLGRSPAGKRGSAYGRRAGVALETQHFPDSPNQAGFPSTILRPGDELVSRTVYRFSVTQR